METQKLLFRLYISNQAPSSQRALSNFAQICEQYFDGTYELEVVDTLEQPLRAMQDGIVITPTLVKLSPEPRWSIVGDLSEDARVLASMQADNNRRTGEPTVRQAKSNGGQHATVKRRVGTSSSRTN